MISMRQGPACKKNKGDGINENKDEGLDSFHSFYAFPPSCLSNGKKPHAAWHYCQVGGNVTSRTRNKALIMLKS